MTYIAYAIATFNRNHYNLSFFKTGVFACINSTTSITDKMYRLQSLARPLLRNTRTLAPRLSASFSTSSKYESPKEIKFGADAKSLMLQGVDLMADAVGVTLGPKVRTGVSFL